MFMQKVRIYSIAALLLLVVTISCRDDDWAPYPDWNENVGAATKITVNASRNSFRLSNGLANEFLEFNLDVDGYEVTQVAEVELLFTFFDATPGTTPVGPKLLKKVNAFPATVQVTAQEAAAAIGNGFTINDFAAGDNFRLTFPIITTEGRRLTVALNSQLCTEPAQPLYRSCQVQWNVVN